MRAILRGGLRALRWLLSFVTTLILCDILLRIAFMLLFILFLPFFILYEHVLPASLLVGKSLRPVAANVFHRLLPAVATFLLSLFPPLLICLAWRHVLLPAATQLLLLVW